jgi:hypothetical protein
MKKIIFFIVLLLVLIGAWHIIFAFFVEDNFYHGYGLLSEIEEKYGVSDEDLVPESIEKIISMREELNELKNTNSSKELHSLIGVRLELLKMGEKFLDGKNKTSEINPLNPDCSEGGKVRKAIELFEDGFGDAELAVKKRIAFVNAFPEKSKAIGIESETLEASVKGLEQSVAILMQSLNELC